MRKIFVVILAFLFAGCSAQSGYPPPSQSERSQTIPARPDAVKEAEKNVLAITLVFKITGNDPLSMVTRTFVPKIEAGATGFMIKPGIVITARHLLVDSISELAKRGILSEIDPISEFPRSANGQYEYTFNATTNINGISEDFKLVPIAMGKLGQHKDYMALRAEKYPKNLKPLETEELKEQEFVYSSGYIPVFSSYPDANGRMISVLSDIIKESFEGQVYEVIQNMPINKSGVNTLYRILGDAEEGFSGGPVLNKKGRVGGVTLEVMRKFIYAVSIKDVNEFIEDLKKRGIIK